MDILNTDWLTSVTCYNTSICKKLHGKLSGGFIINERTGRYNIICYIYSYERTHQSSSCDDGSSGGVCPLPTTSTTEAL